MPTLTPVNVNKFTVFCLIVCQEGSLEVPGAGSSGCSGASYHTDNVAPPMCSTCVAVETCHVEGSQAVRGNWVHNKYYHVARFLSINYKKVHICYMEPLLIHTAQYILSHIQWNL